MAIRSYRRLVPGRPDRHNAAGSVRLGGIRDGANRECSRRGLRILITLQPQNRENRMKLVPWEPDLKTLVDRIDEGDIDLQPDFQRQEIWSGKKKKKLIDTILREWSIPPIFLVVRQDGGMDVLDGQQRLAAVRDFIHNDYAVDGSIEPADERIRSLNGVYYRSFEQEVRRNFNHYSFRCFKITNYSPEEPSELFYRLNQPSLLTAGEQRNAFYGPARAQLKRLVREFEDLENNRDTIGFSNVRLAYDDIFARILFFVEKKSFSMKSTEPLVSQRFRQGGEFDGSTIEIVKRAVARFSISRSELIGVRLNKASALSWLLFYCRFHDDSFDDKFMSNLYLGTPSSKRNFVAEALALFNDRASLRVTDVSSVAYRDFALWYAYKFLGNDNVPPSVKQSVIEEVFQDLAQRDDVTFEYSLAQRLKIESWSVLS